VNQLEWCVDPLLAPPQLAVVACAGEPKLRQTFRLQARRLKEKHGSKCLTADSDGKATLKACTGEPNQVESGSWLQ